MTPDEIIAVVTAHKEGKTIQYKPRYPEQKYEWIDTDTPGWDFKGIDYRIAPESEIDIAKRKLAAWEELGNELLTLTKLDLGNTNTNNREAIFYWISKIRKLLNQT